MVQNTTVQFQKIEEAQFSQEAANISAITERLVATEEGNKLLLSAQAGAEEQILVCGAGRRQPYKPYRCHRLIYDSHSTAHLHPKRLSTQHSLA